MIGTIFLALVIVPIVEIAIFIQVGGYLGLGPTLAVVVLTAFLGAALLRHQGLATLGKARASLEANRFPVDEVFDGLCLILAGALLLTPGFFTDAVGFLLFVPALRRALAGALLRYLAARGRVEIHGAPFPGDAGPGAVIDGEFHDVTPDGAAPGNADGNNNGRDPGGRPGPPRRPPLPRD